MIPITSPIELPHGLHQMYLVTDAEEARKIADGRKAYLYDSRIIKALYLFVPVTTPTRAERV